jgi:hypothetical protein
MESISIRHLNETDYDNILVGWWKEWGWESPSKDFLPMNGRGGAIAFDGDVPICAGFLYLTNSKASWIDWIISSKTYTDREKRKYAISLLISTLTGLSKDMGNKYAYALIKHDNLIKTYQSLGYIKGESYQSEMIKIL